MGILLIIGGFLFFVYFLSDLWCTLTWWRFRLMEASRRTNWVIGFFLQVLAFCCETAKYAFFTLVLGTIVIALIRATVEHF